MASVPDPIDVRPFLAWVEHRAAQLKAEHWDGDAEGIALVLDELGWPRDSGARRLYDWRHGHDHERMKGGRLYRDYRPPLAPVSRARVEDLLEHAGRGLHDVYAEHAERPWTREVHELLTEGVGRTYRRYCIPCKEHVEAGEDATCPWCGSNTVAERPPRHGIRRIGQGRYLTDAQVRAAHVVYERQRLSLRQLGALLYDQHGYASAKSCSTALLKAFKRLGLPTRDRVEMTVERSLKHGLSRRSTRGSAAHNEHRRKLRRKGRTRCTATTHTGRRCEKYAPPGQDVCSRHTPEYIAEHLARTRAMHAKRDAKFVDAFTPQIRAQIIRMRRDWGLTYQQIAEQVKPQLDRDFKTSYVANRVGQICREHDRAQAAMERRAA